MLPLPTLNAMLSTSNSREFLINSTTTYKLNQSPQRKIRLCGRSSKAPPSLFTAVVTSPPSSTMGLKGLNKIFKKKTNKESASTDKTKEAVVQDDQRKDEDADAVDNKEEESTREEAAVMDEKSVKESPSQAQQVDHEEKAENTGGGDQGTQSDSKLADSTGDSSGFCGINLCMPWKSSKN